MNRILGGNMPGRARFDAPGTLQHVIVRGVEKSRIVDDDQDRGRFIERLGSGDDRILGSGALVSQLLREAGLVRRYRPANLDREKAAFESVERYCQENGISNQALSGGSRLRKGSRARIELAGRLTEESGLSFAEIARLPGASTSAIPKIYQRNISKS